MMHRALVGALALTAITAWTLACTAPIAPAALESSTPQGTPSGGPDGADDGGLTTVDGDGGSAKTPEEVLAEAECEYSFRCSAGWMVTDWATPAGCAVATLADLKEHRRADGVTVTADQLRACARALATTSCDARSGDIAECLLRGTRPKGSPCRNSLQCQTGYCPWFVFPGTKDDGTSCPVCADAPTSANDPKENESCEGRACKASLGCRRSTFTCAPIGKLGDECSDVPCDYGAKLTCAKGTDQKLRCVQIAYSQLGGPCLVSHSDGTIPGVQCEASTCSTSKLDTPGTCVAFLPESSPCTLDGPSCAAGLVCDATHTCVKQIPDRCK